MGVAIMDFSDDPRWPRPSTSVLEPAVYYYSVFSRIWGCVAQKQFTSI